jgi:hypothetical protein
MARSRIMYIEDRSGGLSGPARIVRVRFSKTARTVDYGGRTFRRVTGFKRNHVDVETGAPFWITGRDATAPTGSTAKPRRSRPTRTCATSTGPLSAVSGRIARRPPEPALAPRCVGSGAWHPIGHRARVTHGCVMPP